MLSDKKPEGEMIPKLDSSKSYSIVLYTDGGANPNPGPTGSGIHGYIFDDKEVAAKPVELANFTTENINEPRKDKSKGEGGDKRGANSIDYATPTKTGYAYLDKKNFSKIEKTLVKPIAYFEQAFAHDGAATNNVGEMEGLEKAYLAIKHILDAGFKVVNVFVLADSQYVIKTFNEYVGKYKQNGWITTAGTPVKNREIIESCEELKSSILAKGVKIKLEWVRGHGDDLGNNIADYMATIACRSARYRRETQVGKWFTPKQYWENETDRHPLMMMKRGYFNRRKEYNEPGTYFQIEPSDKDTLIGKRDNEAYSIVILNEPCQFQESVREAQGRFGQEENKIILLRNEVLYNKNVQRYIKSHGSMCLGPSRSMNDVSFVNKTVICQEHNPPALFYRVLEIFSFMKERLDDFREQTGKEDFEPGVRGKYGSTTVHDVTDEFYTVEEKKVGNTISEKMVLKSNFTVGYRNHTFTVKESVDGKDEIYQVPVALGMDIPGRNALKQLEEHYPRIYMLSWESAPEVLRYAFVVDCITGTAIWSNHHCDRLFLKRMKHNEQ